MNWNRRSASFAPQPADVEQQLEVGAHRIRDVCLCEEILQLRMAHLAQAHGAAIDLHHVIRNRRARHQRLQDAFSPLLRQQRNHAAKPHRGQQLSDFSSVDRNVTFGAVRRQGECCATPAVDGNSELPEARKRGLCLFVERGSGCGARGLRAGLMPGRSAIVVDGGAANLAADAGV